LAICGADTPRPIPIKFGMRVAPRKRNAMCPIFVIKFSGVSDLQGVKVSVFPLILGSSLQQCCATAQPVKLGLQLNY